MASAGDVVLGDRLPPQPRTRDGPRHVWTASLVRPRLRGPIDCGCADRAWGPIDCGCTALACL